MAQIINLNDSAPAAPANSVNVKWQKGATTGIDPSSGLPIFPASANLPAATTSSLGSVFPDGVEIGIDASGKIFLIGNPVFFKGAWSGTTFYDVGDIVSYSGLPWICISPVDESVAPGVVQSVIAQAGSAAFTSDVVAGHLLVVVLGSHSATSAPTDTLGTLYTLVESSGGPGLFGTFGSLYIGIAPASGPNTVSSATGDIPAIILAEFRGVTGVVNAHTSNNNVSSLSLTTTQPTMIIFARVEHDHAADTYTGTGGVTIAIQQSSSSGRSMALGYVAEGSPGSYTPGISGTVSVNNVVLALACLDGAVAPDQDTTHWLALGTVEPTGSGNKVIATPADGSSGQAALRALVAADLPAATTAARGGVRPDGTSITIAGDVISAAPTGVTSVGLSVPNGFSVSGSPVTGSGTLAVSGVYQLGSFLPGQPSSSQVVGAWGFLYAWTLPANCAGAVGSCTANPLASATYNIQKNGSTVGTVTISTGGAFTFATTGGLAISFAAGDLLTLVAPAGVDATLAGVKVILSANR